MHKSFGDEPELFVFFAVIMLFIADFLKEFDDFGEADKKYARNEGANPI